MDINGFRTLYSVCYTMVLTLCNDIKIFKYIFEVEIFDQNALGKVLSEYGIWIINKYKE